VERSALLTTFRKESPENPECACPVALAIHAHVLETLRLISKETMLMLCSAVAVRSTASCTLSQRWGCCLSTTSRTSQPCIGSASQRIPSSSPVQLPPREASMSSPAVAVSYPSMLTRTPWSRSFPPASRTWISPSASPHMATCQGQSLYFSKSLRRFVPPPVLSNPRAAQYLDTRMAWMDRTSEPELGT
jgi:hypothetical protein